MTQEVQDPQLVQGKLDVPDLQSAPTGVVDRALALLVLIGEAGPLTLTETANRADLNISTTMRLLRTLEVWSFISKDKRGAYALGSRIFEFKAQALSHQRIYELSGEVLSSLTSMTQETSYVGVPTSDGLATYIREWESPKSVRHVGWVGRKVSLEGTAIGSVLLGRTPECGYAINMSPTEEDSVAFAAPVSIGDDIIAALSVAAPRFRVTEVGTGQIGTALQAHARMLSDLLTGTTEE